LALIAEQTGRISEAHTWIEKAIARDARNWRLWLTAARLELMQGNVDEAVHSLRRAALLDPRSPLFKYVAAST
jgi:lipopolysaccharide biosynthesis regulator YciM